MKKAVFSLLLGGILSLSTKAQDSTKTPSLSDTTTLSQIFAGLTGVQKVMSESDIPYSKAQASLSFLENVKILVRNEYIKIKASEKKIAPKTGKK